MSRHSIIAPEDIKRQIAQGEPIVIHEGYVLHLGEWINRHPGGRLAILHMVGRDATDEINMYVKVMLRVMRDGPKLYTLATALPVMAKPAH
jgi:cytochrome b involved in lipid metabolism